MGIEAGWWRTYHHGEQLRREQWRKQDASRAIVERRKRVWEWVAQGSAGIPGGGAVAALVVLGIWILRIL